VKRIQKQGINTWKDLKYVTDEMRNFLVQTPQQQPAEVEAADPAVGGEGAAAPTEVVAVPPPPATVEQEDEKAKAVPATSLPSVTRGTAPDLGYGLMSDTLAAINMPSKPRLTLSS
jgi:hypothetical protein